MISLQTTVSQASNVLGKGLFTVSCAKCHDGASGKSADALALKVVLYSEDTAFGVLQYFDYFGCQTILSLKKLNLF